MIVATIPDIEKIASAHLETETGERIVGKTPSATTEAWVQVTQLDATEPTGSRADHLIRFYVQFDCYASKAGISGSQQREANEIGRAVRQALVEMPDADFDDAVVSGVDIRSHARIPDLQYEPARERMILTAFIWAHDVA